MFFEIRGLRPIVLLAAVFGCVLSTIAWGGSGEVHRLPFRPKLKAKLRLNVDTRGVDGTGYRPIRVEAIPTPGPAPVDRQIRVTLSPNGQSTRKVSALLDIPAGSRSASIVIPVLQDELWYNMGVEVHEGDRPIEELSEPYLNFTRTSYFNWTESSPACLIIDFDAPSRTVRETNVARFKATARDPSPTHDLPDYRNFVRLFPESNYANIQVASDGSQKVSDTELLSHLTELPRAEILPPTELPERWLELTSFDMTFISLDDLQRLGKEHPKQFEALREWLNAGAVLCVYGVGTKFERLEELEKRLRLEPETGARKNDIYRGWNTPDLNKRFSDLPQATYMQVYGNGYATIAPGVQTNNQDGSGGVPKPRHWPFVVRSAGTGYVVALGADNPFPGERSYWTWMLNTVPGERWMWFRRHGMSLHRTNDDYWNFLIPGVGVAPVVSFLLLITLFAAVIGPMNYIFLGRWRRLYLLLITVPAGAAIVTASLFIYALVTDGLGVRARVRSFTLVDAQAGHAVSWSRQSYYASITPSKGLVFPDDTAVYPLLHEPTSRTGQRASGKRMEWADGNQVLKGGYLPSRAATQFLTVRATPTTSKLLVAPQAGGKPPRVKNELGVDIRYLVVADKRVRPSQPSDNDDAEKKSARRPAEAVPQTLWEIADLKAGAMAELKEVSADQVRKRLTSYHRDNALAYPADYDPTSHNYALELLMPDYSYYRSVDMGVTDPDVATSALEQQLARLTRRGEAVLDPATFLAVTNTPLEVPLGVENVRQEKSLHVVHGRW